MDDKLFHTDYFTLFDCQANYQLDVVQLQNKLRQLQKHYHPDNYVAADDAKLNQALMASSYINQAYTTLAEPLARAVYLLQFYGVVVDLVHATKFSNEFLLEQIEWREQIEEARTQQDFAELEVIEQQLQAASKQLEHQISHLFNQADYLPIVELVKQLAFYNKLAKLVSDTLSEL